MSEEIEEVKEYKYEDGTSMNKDIIEEKGQEEWDKMTTAEKNEMLEQRYGFYEIGKAIKDKEAEEKEEGVEKSSQVNWGAATGGLIIWQD